MSALEVQVNGTARQLPAGTTVAELVAALASAQGVAVAVDGEVVPRSRWGEHRLAGGEQIEIVTAVQGG